MLSDVRQRHSALCQWSDIATERRLGWRDWAARMVWSSYRACPVRIDAASRSPLKPRASGDALGCRARAQCLPAVLHNKDLSLPLSLPAGNVRSARSLTRQLRVARSAALCVRPHQSCYYARRRLPSCALCGGNRNAAVLLRVARNCAL
jgi:hypothetical protein